MTVTNPIVYYYRLSIYFLNILTSLIFQPKLKRKGKKKKKKKSDKPHETNNFMNETFMYIILKQTKGIT